MSQNEYAQLQKESQLDTLPVTQIKENSLTVTLLNTCFVKKGLNGMMPNYHLLLNGIIGLKAIEF